MSDGSTRSGCIPIPTVAVRARGAHLRITTCFNGETCRRAPRSPPIGTGFGLYRLCSAAKAARKARGGRMEPMIRRILIDRMRKRVSRSQSWNGRAAHSVDDRFRREHRGRGAACELPEELVAGQTIRTRAIPKSSSEDGKSLFTAPLRGAKADRYLHRVAATARDLRVWQPEFTYHGFRYARIDGAPARVSPKDVHGGGAAHGYGASAPCFRCGVGAGYADSRSAQLPPSAPISTAFSPIARSATSGRAG